MPRRTTETSYGGKRGNLRGPGPKKGARNAGRPTKSFRLFLASIRDSPAAQEALRQAASDPNSRNFGPAWRVLTDYDDDKPAKKSEVSGPLAGPVKVAYEQEWTFGDKTVKF